jgi:translation initiation factor 2B subunit (eIF-2B alpha/beta/delta family)
MTKLNEKLENNQRLNKILEKSRRLTNGENEIHKNLDNIYEESKKLVRKISKTTSSTGDYLLAGKGYDVEKYRRSITNIEIKTDFKKNIEEVNETDIDSSLKHEHDLSIITTIEESKKLVTKSLK